MPERNLPDILANVNFWTKWVRHFGPSLGKAAQDELEEARVDEGADSLDQPIEGAEPGSS